MKELAVVTIMPKTMVSLSKRKPRCHNWRKLNKRHHKTTRKNLKTNKRLLPDQMSSS